MVKINRREIKSFIEKEGEKVILKRLIYDLKAHNEHCLCWGLIHEVINFLRPQYSHNREDWAVLNWDILLKEVFSKDIIEDPMSGYSLKKFMIEYFPGLFDYCKGQPKILTDNTFWFKSTEHRLKALEDYLRINSVG